MNIPQDNKLSLSATLSATEGLATDDDEGTSADTGGKYRHASHDRCYFRPSSRLDDAANIETPIRRRRRRYITPNERQNRAETRRIANREASKRSRDNEKQRLADLKRRREDALKTNHLLVSENNKLRAKNAQLEQQRESLSKKVLKPEFDNLSSPKNALVQEPNPVGSGLGYDAEKLEQEALAWDIDKNFNFRLFEDVDPDEPKV